MNCCGDVWGLISQLRVSFQCRRERQLRRARLSAGPMAPTGTPLPKVPHRVLSRDEVCKVEGGRLIFIGDVHGCVEELKELLELASFRSGQDALIFVGDLVNKGPASGEVLRLAQQLGAYCVRGNHDDDLLQAYLEVGKYSDGLKGYKHKTVYEASGEDIDWLQECPLSLSLPWLGVTVVHSGLIPGVALEDQRFEDLLWMRDLKSVNGKLVGLKRSEPGSVPWASLWKGPELVVFGHDSDRELQQYPFAMGLDTACCKGKALTAMLVDPDNASKRNVISVFSRLDYAGTKKS
eukprot:gb/GFBE01077161.1/.p1 GENE.gb/GFBE01077161.1/~~gb/GFBE01077161.1/.p1  ORF type:complete len:293 (+),score=46.83 gb/GFBE01077161.1/:1-879(+)